jgi:DNA-binding SARP family transcriptional activator
VSDIATLMLHLLGTPRLLMSHVVEHTFERKDAALLALLATEGQWSAARAAGLLWPDSPDRQARANLRQRLFRLRKIASADLVLADNNTLRLAPGVTVDMLQFPQALTGDPAAGAGDLLGGHDYSDTDALAAWVLAARQRWRNQRSQHLAARASEFEAAQQIAAALVLAQRIVADDPLHEHAHRRLMRLHYLRGDRSAALAAYQRCRDNLREELAASPDRETTQLAALIEASGLLPQAAPAPRAIATQRPPRLIGREGPWQRLEQARRGATLLLLEGEAGIGKSRLLDDFAAASGGAPVFGARPGDASLPYALLARIVRGLVERFAPPIADWVLPELARIAPELGTPPPGPLRAPRLQQALLHALAEWRPAGLDLLVIDDLHFADSATLEVLPALTAGLREPGIAWLLAVRPGEVPAAAVPWLDAQDARMLDRVNLEPLDPEGVRALLESLSLARLDTGRWAPMLARHTGGNPLFVLETVIAMLDMADGHTLPGEPPQLPTPERIVRLIERRLLQLSPAALKLARIAAIAGQDFSAALAASVLHLDALDIADRWRELETAQVIRGSGFAHDLILESTLRSIPEPVARLVHHHVAEALRGAGAPPARLAAHWSAALQWVAAADAYVAAARAAFAASRRVEEAQLWDAAVLCYERAGQTDKAFEARCESIETGLATRTAESVLLQTEALLATARSDEQRLDALLAHGRALLTAVRLRDAAPVADEAVALAQQLGKPWLRIAAARLGALSLASGPRAAEGIERLRAFTVQIEAEGDGRQRLDFYSDLVVAVHTAGRRAEAAALYPLAMGAARAAGDTSVQLVCASNLSGLLGQLGRLQEGHAQAEHACRLLERVGDPDGLTAAASMLNLALFNAALGRIDLAISGLEQAWNRLGPGGGTAPHAMCETHLANLWLQFGQPARALHALKPISHAVVVQVAQRQARRLTIEGRIDRALGRSALPRLEQAMALLGPNTDPMLRMYAELDRSREIAPDDALADCRRVQREAQATELLAVAMRARVLAIEALHRAGRFVQAAEQAREAAESWHSCRPADLYWPEALWIGQQALRAAADDRAADGLLDEALAWIHHRAGPWVPAPFRSGFLQRNATNRAILAAGANR